MQEERKGIMPDLEIYKWFIAHVAYHNESNVKNLLGIAALECYMPFRSVVRTWKGAKKVFMIPVIPSCVFVRIPQSSLAMLQMMGELALISDNKGNPLSFTDKQMALLRIRIDTSPDPGQLVLDMIDNPQKPDTYR